MSEGIVAWKKGLIRQNLQQKHLLVGPKWWKLTNDELVSTDKNRFSPLCIGGMRGL